jgi:hypothetical protein
MAKKKEKSIIERQEELLDAGYDIGSTGADGIWGPASQRAYDAYTRDTDRPKRGLSGGIRDFYHRAGRVPLNVNQLAYDVAGGQGAINEKSLRKSELNVLKGIVRKNLAKGKSTIEYGDYGTGTDPYADVGGSAGNLSIIKKAFDPAYNLKTTLGQANIRVTPQDTIISDRYNYNNKVQNPTIENYLRSVPSKGPNIYGQARNVGKYFGSGPGEGSKVDIRYENGGQLPEDNLRARSDSLTAANSNLPWIQRYQQGNELNIPDPYNPGSGKTSTHGLAYHPYSQDSAMIYPEITQQGDSLVHRTGDAAREYAEQNKLGINTDLELAKYYSQDGLIQHQNGGFTEVPNPTSAPIAQDPFILENLPTQRKRTAKELLWDNATNAAIMATQFRRPTQAEYEAVRKGGWERSKVLTDAASWGLVDAMTGKVASKLLPYIARAGKKAVASTSKKIASKKATGEVADFQTMLKEFSNSNTSVKRKDELGELLADSYMSDASTTTEPIKDIATKQKGKTQRISPHTGNVENIPKDFKSEIDWKNWNKEILDNPELLSEYDVIESTTKDAGTWMKNADGTPFKGTPEQFVQSNSKNFKRAYPEGTETVYRGTTSHNPTLLSPEAKTRGFKSVFTGDEDLARGYAGEFDFTKETTRLGPESKRGSEGVSELLYPKDPNQINIAGEGADFTNVPVYGREQAEINILYNLEKQKERIEYLRKSGGNDAEQLQHLKRAEKQAREIKGAASAGELADLRTFLDKENQALQKRHLPPRKYVYTDDISRYLDSQDKTRAIRVSNVSDGSFGDVTMVKHQPGHYLKSAVGNRGTFDLNNPNIFKAAVPLGIGAQAYREQLREFKKGGYLGRIPMYKQGGYLAGDSTPSGMNQTLEIPPVTIFKNGGQLMRYKNGGQIQGGGGQVSFNPPLMVPLESGQIGQMQGGQGGAGGIGEDIFGAIGDFSGGSEFGPEPSLERLISQNPGLEETVPQTTLPLQNGGNLPQYALGSWLSGIGTVASVIPVVGQIAGPILKTAGAIAGKFEEKAAAEKADDLAQRQQQFSDTQAETQAAEESPTISEPQVVPDMADPLMGKDELRIKEYGGGLMEGNFKNPVIVNYRNGQTHNGPQGGIPVDSLGNPSSVSKMSAVGLTKKGEVTWNGYVFSDDLT